MSTFAEEIQKRLGRKRAPLGSELSEVDSIPTGITVLDNLVLGCGGIPIGVTELAADEGAGKTSVGYSFLGQAQGCGYNTMMIDAERRINPDRMDVFGIDRSQLIVTRPLHFEDLLDSLDELFEVCAMAEVPTALLFDSLASLPTREEYEAGLQPGESDKPGKKGKKKNETVAGRARILSRAIRVMGAKVQDAKIAFLIINQLRSKIGGNSGFGEAAKYSVGGDALKYYASIRLWMTSGTRYERRGHTVGKSPMVWAAKNLFAPPGQRVRICLDYVTGWDNDRSLVILGKDIGILPESSHVTTKNARTVEGVMTDVGWSMFEAGKWVEAEAKKAKKKTSKKAAKK